MDPKDPALTTICGILGEIDYKDAVQPYLVSLARNPEHPTGEAGRDQRTVPPACGQPEFESPVIFSTACRFSSTTESHRFSLTREAQKPLSGIGWIAA